MKCFYGIVAISVAQITLMSSACYDFNIPNRANNDDAAVDANSGQTYVDNGENALSSDPNNGLAGSIAVTNDASVSVAVGGKGGSGGVGGTDRSSGAGSGGTPQETSPKACKVGELRCDPQGKHEVEVCTVSGGWKASEECGSVCIDGVCAGVCTPGKKHCGADQIPETCNTEGEWVAASKPCPFVCSNMGECTGECLPGYKRCGGAKKLTPETCNEDGNWVAFGKDCPNICSNGTCAGTCSPDTWQCGANNIREKCSDEGTWEPQDTCQYVCSGDGECTGTCKPRSKSCSGQTRLVCDETGEWIESGDCVDSACSNGGCVGVCTPGALQCGSNETPQKCNTSGKWVSQSKCPYVCSTGGVCGGSCAPGSKTCSGTTLRTCKSDGSGYDEETCKPLNPGETATCSNNACKSTCVSPAKTCPDSKYPNYCWNLEYGCDNCVKGTVFRSATKTWGYIDYICVLPERRTLAQNENATPNYQNGACVKDANGNSTRERMANEHDIYVCVTQARWEQVQAENAAADSNRYVNSGVKPTSP